MDISFEGIGQVVITCRAEEGVTAGMVIVVSSGTVVDKGADGAKPAGVVLGVDNGLAAVQVSGMARVEWTGDSLIPGWNMLACDGTGKVKTVSTGGIEMLVMAVDGNTAVIEL